MNNNTMVISGVIVLLLVGGLIVYSSQKGALTSSDVSTTTPKITDTAGPPEVQKAGTPIVITSTLVIASNSMAVVTGKVVPNGAQTSYWYEYGNTNALGARTGTQSVGGGYINVSTPAIISGLTANVTYYYRLVAQNTFGTVVGQAYSFMTNSNPPLQGVGPTTRTDTASSVTRTTSTLNGQVTPNNADASYWFEYGETAEFGNTTAIQSAGNGTVTKSVSATVSDLKPSTKYYFRLNAQNQFGTMTGGTMSFTTTGPSAVTLPSVITRNASGATKSTATLHGTVNANSADVTYWFEYSSDPLLGAVLNRTTPKVTINANTNSMSVSADVSGLSSSTTYYFRIVAQNSAGTVLGDRVSFKTK